MRAIRFCSLTIPTMRRAPAVDLLLRLVDMSSIAEILVGETFENVQVDEAFSKQLVAVILGGESDGHETCSHLEESGSPYDILGSVEEL